MALAPKPVHTRKIALAAEYGVLAAHLIEDGFTEDYFTVYGEANPGVPAHEARTAYASFEIPKTRYYWRPEDRGRAAEAIEGDYREMIGPERYAEVQSLKAFTRTD